MENRSEIKETDLKDVPVKALRSKSRNTLSCMLNKKKIIPTPEGYCRDYRGIANLMKFSVSCWSLQNNPTETLIEKSDVSVNDLLQFLKLIDRFDVLEDCYDLFLEDARLYKSKETQIVITSSPFVEEDIIVTGDTPSFKRKFDAFLLYVDEDFNFAKKIKDTLESDPYRLQLCDRGDILAGAVFENRLIEKLISERCLRLIVILSDEFLQSKDTVFVHFADYLRHHHQVRKIIPIKYKDCHAIPDEVSKIFFLDFRRNHLVSHFWERLYCSIKSNSESCESSPFISKLADPVLSVTEKEPLISDFPSVIETPGSSKTLSVFSDEDIRTGTSFSNELFRSIRKMFHKRMKKIRNKKVKEMSVYAA